MTEISQSVRTKIALAAVGIVGGLIGAMISHYYTRAEYLEKTLIAFRQNAYTDFFRGQSLLWSSPDKLTEANQLILSAKLNILLSGSPEVIEAMTKYWVSEQKFKVCEDAEEKQSDVAIYQAMRAEFFDSLGLESNMLPIEVLVPYLRSCKLSSD